MFKKVSSVADGSDRENREMTPRAVWFIVMIFLVGGILISACAIRIDWILLQSKTWPQAEGRVVSVERVGHDKYPTYTYQYTANGKTHTSTNIEPGADSGNYPLNEGERVEVRHSPDANPYSFLMNTDIKSMILIHVIGFGWLAVSSIALFALLRGPMARSKPSDSQLRIDGCP